MGSWQHHTIAAARLAAHHGELALIVHCCSNDRGGVVREHARERRQVAGEVAIDLDSRRIASWFVVTE